MSEVEIATLTNEADWKTFIDLPWKIYADDRNWVPPIKKLVRRLLDPERHPFWRFSQGEFFLARRGTRAVGRIAAIIDNKYNQYRNEKVGSWGFFECENDPEAASALFSSAMQWITAKGMTFARGPLNPSTNYETGMLIEGFEHPPTFMMTYNPEYYVSLAESCGLKKEKDLLALILLDPNPGEKRPFLERVAQRIREKGNVRIRPADTTRFGEEIPLIKSIYDSGWSHHWGFAPMSDGELVEMGRNVVRIVDPDLVFFVYYNDEAVGFCLIVPDVNPVIKRLNGKLGPLGFLKMRWYSKEIRGLRGLLFGFKESHQKMGLPLVAFQHLNQLRAAKEKYHYLELGWNLEDNHDINQFEMDLGARVHKRYRVYGTSLV